MKTVLIVGLGLLGGSYARGLTEKGYRVTAIDVNGESIEFALREKFIIAGSTEVQKELLACADIVIFGVYPNLLLDWVKKYQSMFKSGAILTDVLGVKSSIVAGMEEILREDVFFVGAHPMAGKEVSGVEHSDPEMFKKANFIITPTEKTDKNAISQVETIAKDLEFKEISYLSPLDHDKAIGFLSQLTHVIAVSLMNCNEDENFVKYTGDSFRDLTRIAMINENLWSQLFLTNKNLLLDEIDKFSHELLEFRELLETENLDGMKEKFITSTERRKKYQK